MNPLFSSAISIGRTPQQPAQNIGGLNAPPLEFSGTFSPPFSDVTKVRLIVSPNFDRVWDPANPGAAPVCNVIVLTTTDFTATVINQSELAGMGNLSLNWLAVEETPQETTQSVSVRLGLTIPQGYVPQNTPNAFGGWWQRSLAIFASPLQGKSPIAVITATDPFGSFKPQAAAIAGTVHKPGLAAFEIAGLSTDSAAGGCAFAYLAASMDKPDETGLVVDTGVVDTQQWDSVPGNGPGQWQSIGVRFSARFNEPPIVLLTPSSLGLQNSPPPVVGLVSDVTNDYFVLNARYLYSGRGFLTPANFFWIAIGCGLGCGQGPVKLPVIPLFDITVPTNRRKTIPKPPRTKRTRGKRA
jgi:hypothetical protein